MSTQSSNQSFGSNITMTTEKINQITSELTMENGLLPTLGIFCASVVLLLATWNNKEMTASMKGYANSVSSICMILSFLLLLRAKQMETYSRPIRYFLFFWSFLGACILTNLAIGPFSKTGNGYFCSWALVVFSFFSLG
jgi:hypothetical protein